ncbi:ribosome maturation factor RimP [Nocardia speluncae]|uniref:Ribosome maturation factor RimP n=1 Tax=Nocardia speluncae TaxID=419477 RepID=A0A846XGA6_9NOCA|nr:ribosome maturation factor RimP [Nocardia speluncae]NKY35158.1 ribosome maturation factor RimP [Nocardia speluncae]
MPMPTEEGVSRLVAGLVAGRGFDLEGVEVSTAAGQTRVRVIVDSDETADLDSIAELSSEVSARLDEADDEFGGVRYLLEVTTPGVDRPLTADRHWRRARGRKVRVRLRPGVTPPEPGLPTSFEARAGALDGDRIALVLGGKRAPHLVTVGLGDIERAVVEVEFASPNARELELTGGVASGRPPAGADAAEHTATTVDASDSTEGIME